MVMRSACLVLVAVGALACVPDRYRCTNDLQCDLGEGGRCERDGLCTQHDLACPTQRRYSAHAGEQTGTCFDDRQVPLNACAGGQPPVLPEGCLATVCERLPYCCGVAWTDACVQLAQEACTARCDTRIAITAIRGVNTELWDVRWTGEKFSVTRVTTLGAPLAWVAPAPATLEPRLAGTTPTTLVIGETSIAIAADRSYQSITSIGVDRDGRDTIVAGYQQTQSGTHAIEIVKLESGTVREAAFPASQNLTWGDRNRDGFPDGIVKNGVQYSFLDNLEDGAHVRTLANQATGNLTGGPTPGAPGTRAIDWLDLDGDHLLDLAVFGASLRIHTSPDVLRDTPNHELDCDPPSTARPCMAEAEPDLERASYGGAALPTVDGASLVISVFPGRRLYRARRSGDGISVDPLRLPGDACNCAATCTNCPGGNCSCTYDCSSCATIAAVVVRDLDGDQRLDIVAIDARLQIYTAFARDNYAFGAVPTIIPTPATQPLNVVNVSVSGAPLP